MLRIPFQSKIILLPKPSTETKKERKILNGEGQMRIIMRYLLTPIRIATIKDWRKQVLMRL